MNHKNQKGSVLVEVVIATSVFLVAILAISAAASFVMRSSLENLSKLQAAYLAEEGLEATRLLRDASWSSNISSKVSGTPFYISFNGSSWTSGSTSPGYIGGVFDRSITLSDVYRDGSQNIVTSGGSLDPNIKMVTATVSWNSRGATSTRSISTYLANVFNN